MTSDPSRAATRRPRPFRSFVAAVLGLLVATGVMVPLAATSASAAAESLVSDNPLNYTPRVLDGRVLAVVRVGDTVVVGGTFTRIQEASDSAPVLTQRALFAFDATTGAIDPDFQPVLRAGTATAPVRVNAIVPAADGASVYVGGNFAKVNELGPSKVQDLTLATGTRVAGFKHGNINSEVYDLALSGDRLFVGGSFTKVGQAARVAMASLDATTGALTDAFTLPFAGVNNGGKTTVRKMAVTPAGDRLVAIGNFTSLNGQARPQIAMADISGASATVSSWYTTRFPNECASAFDSYMRDISMSDDGSFFVVVTTGAWGGTARLCDSATRWETYRTGQQLQPSWIAYTGGDTFWAVEVVGSVAYVGGHFRWLNNSYPPRGDAAGPGAVTRKGLAALDVRNGLPFSWDPTRKRGVGVFDFFMGPTELWAGSDTDTWANEYRPRLAGFPVAGGTTLPADRLGTLPGDVVLLDSQAVNGTGDTQVRHFDGTVVTNSSSLSGTPDWGNARGAVMIDGFVYVGQSDGTLVRRTFDGANFGPAVNLPLGGIGLVSDLPRVTSMFYDRALGRLYFTLRKSTPNSNDGGLYYRWFTPESGVVGAVRWDPGQAAASVIDPSNVKGAFLTGGYLYFVDGSGAMKRIAFSDGAFSGSASVVNSAVDWRASGLFLATS